MRPVLIVGGAPRVPVDAVRHLTVAATGGTAMQVATLLHGDGVPAALLLSVDAVPADGAARYATRADLDAAVRAWIAGHADGVIVLSAAINDFDQAVVAVVVEGREQVLAEGAKAPSRGDGLVIRLRPAAKLIDQLRDWGHRGPLVGFKYEAADTVVTAAQALRRRVGADLVVANSLDGEVQALVDAEVTAFPDRPALVVALAGRIAALAAS